MSMFSRRTTWHRNAMTIDGINDATTPHLYNHIYKKYKNNIDKQNTSCYTNESSIGFCITSSTINTLKMIR